MATSGPSARVEAQLDDAAGARRGDAEADRVEVLEVVRVERDPVAVLDERGALAAAGVGRGLVHDARGTRRSAWLSAVRPVVDQYSACLSLGCRIACGAAGDGADGAGALVGVRRLDDREDVGLGAVAAVRGRVERALAALLLGQLVGVLVMAERCSASRRRS